MTLSCTFISRQIPWGLHCTCSCLWGPSEHGWRRWLTHWLGRSLTSLWKRWGWSAKERVNIGLVVACHRFTLLSAKFEAKPGHWRERRMLVCLGRWRVTYVLKIIFFSYFSRDMMLLYDYICSSLGWLFQELRLSYPAITQSLNSFVTYNRGWLLAHPKFSAALPFALARFSLESWWPHGKHRSHGDFTSGLRLLLTIIPSACISLAKRFSS